MEALYVIIALVLGVAVGFSVAKSLKKDSEARAEAKASEKLREAEAKRAELVSSVEKDVAKAKEDARHEFDEKQKYVLDLEAKTREREKMLDQRSMEQDKAREDIDKKYEEIIKLKDSLKELRVRQEEGLEKIAKMTQPEAKELLLTTIEKQAGDEVLRKMKSVDNMTEQELERAANMKISTVISRLASDLVAESTIYTVEIPNEEMKGRLIGKEGRNIQSFEKVTGVDLLIDDTPGAVVVSSFSPMRREVARVALTQLIRDGRINPGRIEEVVEKAQEEVARVVQKAGEEAAVEAKVPGLPKEVIKVLGQLKFRTSYGQNVLAHSIEVAKIAGMLAQELKADTMVVRRAGLLHDIGKAIDKDIQAPHHHISGDIAKKYDLGDAVVHAILAHHDDVEPTTIEAWIVRAADAISSARPGARRGTYEEYVERLQEIENIAISYDGVNRAFAIQAGREVRVLVDPKQMDDLGIAKLAKQIAHRIEDEMQYPGQVRVNVIRETRAQAVAE